NEPVFRAEGADRAIDTGGNGARCELALAGAHAFLRRVLAGKLRQHVLVREQHRARFAGWESDVDRFELCDGDARRMALRERRHGLREREAVAREEALEGDGLVAEAARLGRRAPLAPR